MRINGYFYLHIAAIILAVIPAVLSYALYLLKKERWRLFLSLFFISAGIFVLCDSFATFFPDAGPVLSLSGPVIIFFLTFCITGIFIIPVLVRLYFFGMEFVLKRWEKKYLFLFLIPCIYLITAAFLFFSVTTRPLLIILFSYTSLSGLLVYIMSQKKLRNEKTSKENSRSERELVYLLMTTAVLLPLDLFEYAYKLIVLKGSVFPVNMVLTPMYLIVIGLFFSVTGFRSFRNFSFPGIENEFLARLTAREKEVAGLITEGLTHREISLKLFISRRTVDRHVENIYRKSGARNKSEFIRSVIPVKN